jgi:glyoxylase-like metal-dependent hydrolase (beta-lactamase superfamily II)
VWNGNVLTVTTTHLKPAFVRRNGVPRSEGAVLREHFIRHDNILTHVSVVHDPAYLTEPFIRSQSWVLSPYQVIAPYPCDPAEENSLPRHSVPHYLPGQNPYLREYAERHQLPLEGVRGGAGTMYPEFIEGKARSGSTSSAPASATALARNVNVLHVQAHVYMLHTPHGNVTVLAGDEGIAIVDPLRAELADEIFAAVAPLSANPIRLIVNTQAHESRTGGNGTLAARGRSVVGGNVVSGGVNQAALSATARIVAHENVLTSMTDARPARRSDDLPTDVFYTDRRDLFFNGEGVQISHVPAARSNGDSIVYFRRSDVISAGDLFRTDAFPFIDLDAGGSVQGVIDGLNAIIDLAIPAAVQEGGTMIVPGRGRLADESDVVEYRDMVVIVRDRVKDGLEKGLTLPQVQATAPTLGYDWQYGRSTDGWTGEDFVAVVYRDLSRSR